LSKSEIVEGLVAGVLSSGVLVSIVKWASKQRTKPGYKRVIRIERDDGTVLLYETAAENLGERPEVRKIVEWLEEVETKTGGEDHITSISFTLEPLDRDTC
jgi:hypothetical protein